MNCQTFSNLMHDCHFSLFSEPRTPNDIGAGCIRDTVAYISFSSFGVGIFVSLTVTIVLFRKVIIKMNKNTT